MPTPTAAFTCTIDTAEPRVSKDVQAVVTDGRYFDPLLSSAFIDPISRTAFLMPLYKTAAWQTSGCGRIGLGGFSFAGSASNWVEYQRAYAVEKYLHNVGNTNEGVVTNATWPKNQPFVLSWYSYNAGNEEFVQMECGWSNGTLPYSGVGTNDPDIRLRFWSNGKCEIFKNGVFVGEGNIFERRVTTQTQYGTQTSATKHDSKQLAAQTVDVLLIPCRRRELLLLSNQGGGFLFTFEDIDPDDPDPTITGAGKFFWYVPVGQATAQLAPMQTLTSGYVFSLPTAFREPPAAGASVTTSAFYDLPGFGSGLSASATLYLPDGSGAFVPNGSRQLCRLRLDMAGSGAGDTPFVYGGAAVVPATVVNTDGLHSTLLDAYITGAHLSVPESPTDVQMDLTLNQPDALEAAGASGIRVVGNRPLVAKIGTIAFLTGRTKWPRWEEAINDTARDLMLEARDRIVAMERHRMKSPIPIDGANLSDALAYFVKQPGFSSGDLDIAPIAYALPTSGPTSEGEYALLPEVGDTSLQWVQKLWETYARNYSWGWVPRVSGPKFRFHTLDYYNSQTVAATLYGTVQEALAAGRSRTDFPRAVYRKYRETILACEANDIWVTGRNPRTGQPIQTHYADYASQNPTTVPALRPDNWTGDIQYYGWVDPSLTSTADTDYCCEQLARRLVPSRAIGEWETDFLLWANGQPVWRNDLVRLVGLGTYRVMSLSGDFKAEYADAGGVAAHDLIWRPFTYVGELVTPDL